MPSGILARVFNRREIDRVQKEIGNLERSADWWAEQKKREYLEREETAQNWSRQQQEGIDNLFSKTPFQRQAPPPEFSPKWAEFWQEYSKVAAKEAKHGMDLVDRLKNQIVESSQKGENFHLAESLFDSDRRTAKEIAQNMSVEAINGVLGRLSVSDKESREESVESGNGVAFKHTYEVPDLPEGVYGSIIFNYTKNPEGRTTVSLDAGSGRVRRIEPL